MARAAILDIARRGRRRWWSAAVGFICARCAAEFSGAVRIAGDSRRELASGRGRTRHSVSARRADARSIRRQPRASSATICTESCARSRFIASPACRFARIRSAIALPTRDSICLTVALEVPRKQLYETIDRRFDAMIAAGFVEEVRAADRGWLRSRATAIEQHRLSRSRGASARRNDAGEADRARQAQDAPIRETSADLVSPRTRATWLDAHRGAEQALMLFEKFFSDDRANADQNRKWLRGSTAHAKHHATAALRAVSAVAIAERDRARAARAASVAAANAGLHRWAVQGFFRDSWRPPLRRRRRDRRRPRVLRSATPVAIVGQQRGRSTADRIKRNFGKPHPEGYRKAARVYELADRFGLPLITFIDTQGAESGVGAEERGQTEAIAHNLELMARLDGAVDRMRYRRGWFAAARSRSGSRTSC